MIKVRTWLTQIVRYCEFITNDDAVKKAWIDCDLSDTSVSGFNELYEQIFDDLDSDNFDFESSGISLDLVTRIKNFIKCLHELNKTFEDDSSSADILKSKQWTELKRSASAVLSEDIQLSDQK